MIIIFCHRGFTLIEVLVSLFILMFMLLSLEIVEITALNRTKSAYYFSVAEQQVYNMLQYLQLLNIVRLDEQFLVWNNQNKVILPQGYGVVTAKQVCIFWGKNLSKKCLYNEIGLSGCLCSSIN